MDNHLGIFACHLTSRVSVKKIVGVWINTWGISVRHQTSQVRMSESAEDDVNLSVSMGSLAAIDKECRRRR